jgi:DNA-binding transcriptional regulator YiaG
MNATSKNRSAMLRHLRKQAAAEEDQEKLRSIAVQVLRVLKRDDSPSAVHPWTEKVRSLRKKLRFSQTQLAAKLGVLRDDSLALGKRSARAPHPLLGGNGEAGGTFGRLGILEYGWDHD